MLANQEAIFNRPSANWKSQVLWFFRHQFSGVRRVVSRERCWGVGSGCYISSQNVSALWLGFEEETTASSDWIGCRFNRFRGHVLMTATRKEILLLEWNKPIIKILVTDLSKPYKCGSTVKVNVISHGILRNFMWQNAANVYDTNKELPSICS